ncbi:DNA polymerase-3 subunit epsilon [Paenibacillus shirakamiensis]|uniref:DNA polymerase-3 subunit epsilon n=1 Tax=Paenibacillus shirakamiensis TaxID=1265935 RepID=A0ABS4JID5_9BACL|nr:exonuclease domain-containing protein [Paenibacillus shirakamiensis]MBP2000741.1 DNA polymerase-3 subunit epsilon [Paenibacillus shirakamiensis]
MNFVSIDFETANMTSKGSVCSVGIAVVEDGHITKEFYSLVNPLSEFDPHCVRVHGITEHMVQDAPTFKEVWSTIGPMLDGQTVIAHNAAFDMNVLSYCISTYELPSTGFQYLCSYLVAKRIWPELPSYRLNQLSSHLQLSPFRHHDALEDAKAAALVFIECLKDAQTSDYNQLATQLEYRLGQLQDDYTHITFSSTRSTGGSVKASQIVPQSNDFDKDHTLYRKQVVFSGTLSSISRREAMQKVADLGGLLADKIHPGVHYLVVGSKDYMKHQHGLKSSSKIRAAEKLASSGKKVRIIPEEDFMSLLSS